MAAWLIKHKTLILIALLVAFFSLVWLFPSAAGRLGIAFLLLSFLTATFVIFQKHRELYLQGEISRSMFLRNVFLEMAGAGLAMALAALLGRTIVEVATQQISDDLTRFIAGIAMGLSTGMAVGFLFSRTWGRYLAVTSAQ